MVPSETRTKRAPLQLKPGLPITGLLIITLPCQKCWNFENYTSFIYSFNYIEDSWFGMDDLCIANNSSRMNWKYVRESVAEWTKCRNGVESV